MKKHNVKPKKHLSKRKLIKKRFVHAVKKKSTQRTIRYYLFLFLAGLAFIKINNLFNETLNAGQIERLLDLKIARTELGGFGAKVLSVIVGYALVYTYVSSLLFFKNILKKGDMAIRYGAVCGMVFSLPAFYCCIFLRIPFVFGIVVMLAQITAFVAVAWAAKKFLYT